eukprot:CAMPEP_0201612056 /NCGR_PEP_ID=MMETSP0492-20130828/21965_1 /ASSEMBLY_ACC=CAM_ASM_000837 /TAXON_ID=420259 /ORGANISM="Thalassiosira gravida, Strain GMp14c1" /LENGTH=100 /DNA_ID=CAMNT_0048078443 /DNA_START=135 /DNA_END=438 /DNA_ORIENTATION=+
MAKKQSNRKKKRSKSNGRGRAGITRDPNNAISIYSANLTPRVIVLVLFLATTIAFFVGMMHVFITSCIEMRETMRNNACRVIIDARDMVDGKYIGSVEEL